MKSVEELSQELINSLLAAYEAGPEPSQQRSPATTAVESRTPAHHHNAEAARWSTRRRRWRDASQLAVEIARKSKTRRHRYEEMVEEQARIERKARPAAERTAELARQEEELAANNPPVEPADQDAPRVDNRLAPQPDVATSAGSPRPAESNDPTAPTTSEYRR